MTWLMIEHGCHRQLNNERKKKFEEAKKTKRKYIVNVKPRRVIWQKRLPADKVTEDTKQFHELTTSRTTEDEVKQKDQLVGGTGGRKKQETEPSTSRRNFAMCEPRATAHRRQSEG